MPEAVTDRPSRAHEYLFLLAKNERYYYDHQAIKEPVVTPGRSRGLRNRRSVWTINIKPFHGAHFAVMPEALVEPCILAGCPEGGLVLDPFGGAGTVGVVAQRLLRHALLIELNPEYVTLARERLTKEALWTAEN